jgi:hypothetical protein
MRVEDMREVPATLLKRRANRTRLGRIDHGAHAVGPIVHEIGIVVGEAGNEVDNQLGH